MVTEALNRRARPRCPKSSRARSWTRARILLEDAGLQEDRHPVSRELRGSRHLCFDQRPARGQMVYETTWRSRSGSPGAATSSTCRRSIAGATLRQAATSCGTDVLRVRAHVRSRSSRTSRATAGGSTIRTSRRPSSLRWLSHWTAFTIDLDWPGGSAETRPRQTRGRHALSNSRHQARARRCS